MYRMTLVCLLALLLAPPAVCAQGCDANGLCTFANLDDLSRLQWQHCTDSGCAGGKGLTVAGVANTTESAPYNFTVDSSSLRFDLDYGASGCTSDCFSNVLFFTDPSGAPNASTDAATKITIDLYAGLDPTGISGSQALEFNVFQTFCTSGPCPNGTYTRFTYSYQCDFADGVWRVWGGPSAGWVNTNPLVTCSLFSNTNPNGASFNHFTFNFTRGADLNNPTITYTDFWVNGTHHVLNQTLGTDTNVSGQPHEFEPSIQLDGNGSGTSYSLWTDQWTVTASH
jgi:hypothetical protein